MERHGAIARTRAAFSRRLQNRLENIDSILLPHSRQKSPDRVVRAVAVSVPDRSARD